MAEDLIAAARAAIKAAEAALVAASAQRAETPAADASDGRLLYRFEHAEEMLACSRTCLFELVRSGHLEAVTLPGGGRRIPAEALSRFVHELRAHKGDGARTQTPGSVSTTSSSPARKVGDA